MRTGDARGSEVLCLRHGSRLREAGKDTQHGSILSQETLVHPPQALGLSQSRESLHRGGERDREGQTEKACREAGRMQRERLVLKGVHIQSHRRVPTHTHTQNKTAANLRGALATTSKVKFEFSFPSVCPHSSAEWC